MLQVEYVCLLPVKENFEKVFKIRVIALELPMKHSVFGMQWQNTKNFNFKLRGASEFCEVSQKLLLLTGTISVRNLEFKMQAQQVLEIPVTANICEF